MKNHPQNPRHLSVIDGGLDKNGDPKVVTEGVGETPRQERVAKGKAGKAFVRMATKFDNSAAVRRAERMLDGYEVDAPGTGLALTKLSNMIFDRKKNPNGTGQVTRGKDYRALAADTELLVHTDERDGSSRVVHALVGAGQTMLMLVGDYDNQGDGKRLTLMATRFGSLSDTNGEGVYAKPIILGQIDYSTGDTRGIKVPINRTTFSKDALIDPNQGEITVGFDGTLRVQDFGSRHGTYVVDEGMYRQNPHIRERVDASALNILEARPELFDPAQAHNPRS